MFVARGPRVVLAVGKAVELHGPTGRVARAWRSAIAPPRRDRDALLGSHLAAGGCTAPARRSDPGQVWGAPGARQGISGSLNGRPPPRGVIASRDDPHAAGGSGGGPLPPRQADRSAGGEASFMHVEPEESTRSPSVGSSRRSTHRRRQGGSPSALFRARCPTRAEPPRRREWPPRARTIRRP